MSSFVESIKSAQTNPVALKFMKHFKERKYWRKILLAHKLQVFETVDLVDKTSPLSWFVFDSFGDIPNVQEALSTMMVDVDQSDIQEAWINRHMPTITDELRPYVEEIVFGLINFIRSRPQLMELLQSPGLNRSAVKMLLDNHEDLRIGDFIESSIMAGSLFDGGVKKTIQKAVDYGLRDPKAILQLLSLPPVRLIVATPYAKLRDLLRVQDLKWDEYAAALSEWYSLGAVTNENGTVFWCGDCSDDRVSCNVDARLAPTHLQLNCPRCAQPMEFVTAYFAAPWLREAILSKDGFLLFALAMHLSSKNMTWEAGKTIGGLEIDLLVDRRFAGTPRTVVIETKMFQTDRTPDVIRQNLYDAARQLTRSTKAVIESGRKVDSAVVVTNYDLKHFSEERKKILKSINRSANPFRVHILDFAETIQHLDEMEGQTVDHARSAAAKV